MEKSWQNELLKYWHIIENETATLLLKYDHIKDDVLFDNGFKDDFLQNANKKIEHTYERFLNDSKELRRMGNCNRSYTNANEQRNRSNQSISYGGGSGNVESTDISTHQPNLNSSLSNEKQTVWSREPNPQAIDGVSSSYISMSPSESSSTTESMGTRDIEQQSLGEVHEKLSVSFGQHSNTDYDLDDLNDVLDDLNCLDNKEMDLVVKGLASVAPADYSIIFANDESQTTNLEQDSASQTTEDNNNIIDDGSTDSQFDLPVDSTSNSDAVLIEQQSVTVTPESSLNNNVNKSNALTQTKKRKHVTLVDAETLVKKRKIGTGTSISKQSSVDSCSTSTQQHKNLTIDNRNEMPYKCTICAEEFNRLPKFQAHKKTHEKQSFQCRICCKKFDVKKTCKTHENQCKKTGHECYLCKKRTSKVDDLKIHMSQHIGLK